jgi:hypothetical protein
MRNFRVPLEAQGVRLVRHPNTDTEDLMAIQALVPKHGWKIVQTQRGEERRPVGGLIPDRRKGNRRSGVDRRQ